MRWSVNVALGVTIKLSFAFWRRGVWYTSLHRHTHTHLVADFLTKPVGVAARWQHFLVAMGVKPVVEAATESLRSKVR